MKKKDYNINKGTEKECTKNSESKASVHDKKYIIQFFKLTSYAVEQLY